MMRQLRFRWWTLFAAASLAGASAPPAVAQVYYNPGQGPLLPFPYADPSPYDQAFGTRPSFEVQTDPYARGPAVRVVTRCLYPDGWNVTDFVRDINGTPPGIDHQCPVVQQPLGGRVRARY